VSDVSAPVALPWDVDAVAIAALDILRLDPADDDAQRITDAAMSATRMIDKYLDYAVAPDEIESQVFDAAVDLTIERYRRKDSPFGVTDAWSPDGASIRLSSDQMRGVRSLLTTSKSRFGVG
jgi:hypothetical protein